MSNYSRLDLLLNCGFNSVDVLLGIIHFPSAVRVLIIIGPLFRGFITALNVVYLFELVRIVRKIILQHPIGNIDRDHRLILL